MSIRFDERWAQGRILLWINEVLKSQKVPFSKADQEVQMKTSREGWFAIRILLFGMEMAKLLV